MALDPANHKNARSYFSHLAAAAAIFWTLQVLALPEAKYKMQRIGEAKRPKSTKLQQRFSLILQDLKYQLNYLDESSAIRRSSDIAHIRTDSFTKIDVNRCWVFPYPADDYAEEPQER